MNASSLRKASIPRYALRKEEAAASFGISSGLFEAWIKDQKMPKGHKIGGVVLWDADELWNAWLTLRDGENKSVDNPFDGVVA